MVTDTSTVAVSLFESVTVQRMTAVRDSPAVMVLPLNVVVAEAALVIEIEPPETLVQA
jgi:hypothetical protein